MYQRISFNGSLASCFVLKDSYFHSTDTNLIHSLKPMLPQRPSHPYCSATRRIRLTLVALDGSPATFISMDPCLTTELSYVRFSTYCTQAIINTFRRAI